MTTEFHLSQTRTQTTCTRVAPHPPLLDVSQAPRASPQPCQIPLLPAKKAHSHAMRERMETKRKQARERERREGAIEKDRGSGRERGGAKEGAKERERAREREGARERTREMRERREGAKESKRDIGR